MSNLNSFSHNDASSPVKNEASNTPHHSLNLWHDAYEHRGAIAAAAVGTAAVVAAAVVEHTPVGRALGLAKGLLVVEDTALFSHCISKSLLAQGEKLTIIRGVESLKPFVGILENGDKKAFNLNKIRAAFVDGDLVGNHQGPAVAEALGKKSVFTIAMSSDNDINKVMITKGATIGEQKSVIMQALREDTLRVDEAMKDPMRTQAELDDRQFHFNDKAQTTRRRQMEKELMDEFLEEEDALAKAKIAAKGA